MGELASSPVGSTNHRQAGECSTVGRPGLGIARKQDGDSAVVSKMHSLYYSLPVPAHQPQFYWPDSEIDFRVKAMKIRKYKGIYEETCLYTSMHSAVLMCNMPFITYVHLITKHIYRTSHEDVLNDKSVFVVIFKDTYHTCSD